MDDQPQNRPTQQHPDLDTQKWLGRIFTIAALATDSARPLPDKGKKVIRADLKVLPKSRSTKTSV